MAYLSKLFPGSPPILLKCVYKKIALFNPIKRSELTIRYYTPFSLKIYIGAH